MDIHFIPEKKDSLRKKDAFVETYGSVEGVLSASPCSGEGVFVVEEGWSGALVECRMEGELISQAKEAIGRRVVIDGRVLTRSDGSKRLWARKMYVRPLREELPPLEFFRGIAPDMTGGLPSEVYVKRRFYGEGCKPQDMLGL